MTTNLTWANISVICFEDKPGCSIETISVDEHSCTLSGAWDFKFNSVATETTLTQYTAESYRLLTEWLESSPAQVLAALEGVSVVTIRNRLHSAREQGLLEKPGPGKRGSKKS